MKKAAVMMHDQPFLLQTRHLKRIIWGNMLIGFLAKTVTLA